MTSTEIAERLAALEADVALLKTFAKLSGKGHPIEIIERIHGTFQNDKPFQEAAGFGRQWRRDDGISRRKRRSKCDLNT